MVDGRRRDRDDALNIIWIDCWERGSSVAPPGAVRCCGRTGQFVSSRIGDRCLLGDRINNKDSVQQRPLVAQEPGGGFFLFYSSPLFSSSWKMFLVSFLLFSLWGIGLYLTSHAMVIVRSRTFSPLMLLYILSWPQRWWWLGGHSPIKEGGVGWILSLEIWLGNTFRQCYYIRLFLAARRVKIDHSRCFLQRSTLLLLPHEYRVDHWSPCLCESRCIWKGSVTRDQCTESRVQTDIHKQYNVYLQERVSCK